MATALVSNLICFDPRTGEEKQQALKQPAATRPKREKRLFCAACRHPVTHQDQRIPVQGAHEHHCTNPHGIAYHISCFREAPGCAPIGEATTEFTWFPGYAWRIALCTNCRAHLGWRFQSPDDYFHGLIVARLTSAGPVKN
ncbi:hypothetical protein SCL_0416 [Sulfuricaulis limicola]|uniref:CULT domain-containing protein n=1 Tax=Sulfuricaulis limicola TaxID=1620215 RepID=A0A1B4XD61_9GAMM|nr:cereblon family protein [Sulfuricaulis limicola]BAV32738.1 hypothetical protein SCL_0416 [Sulfuricaulis limicola]